MAKLDVGQTVLCLMRDIERARFQRGPRPGLRAPTDLPVWEAQYQAGLEAEIRAYRDTCA